MNLYNMKFLKYILGFFLFLSVVTAQSVKAQSPSDIIAIDPGFKAALFASPTEGPPVDLNNDTHLQRSEAESVTRISVSNNNLTSLAGIEAFINLEILYCSDNQLTGLVLSNNTALTDLRCYSNQLTNLVLTNNTALTSLACADNLLTNLNIDNNTALTYLECQENELINLNVDKNLVLQYLLCSGNQLTNLNVDNNTALTSLQCSNNQLTNLNVDKNTLLYGLTCSNNQLTSLNVDKNIELRYFACNNNQLSCLNIKNLPYLNNFDARNNAVTLSISVNNINTATNKTTWLKDASATYTTDVICGCSYVVKTTVDNGNNESPTTGSLRAAILCANNQLEGDIEITFAIEEAGPYNFVPNGVPLPAISRIGKTTIDGLSQIASGKGTGTDKSISIHGDIPNFISGLVVFNGQVTIQNLKFSNAAYGVRIMADDQSVSSANSLIKNCTFENSDNGIFIYQNNNCTIESCIFTSIGNRAITLIGSSFTKVYSCKIGVNAANQLFPVPYGILISDNSNSSEIGAAGKANIIASSLGQIGITLGGGNKNKFSYNEIYGFSNKAIVLNGSNDDKQAPVITKKVVSETGLTVSGTTQAAGDIIQLFVSDGNPQNANTYIDQVTATSVSWTYTIPNTFPLYTTAMQGGGLVATATDGIGNTSELGIENICTVVTTTDDSGDNNAPTPGSLRAAIICANAATERTTITFAIRGIGPYTIQVKTNPLPDLTNPLGIIIDGAQAQSTGGSNQRVTIDGGSLVVPNGSAGYSGFKMVAANNQLSNLDIINFTTGVHVASANNKIYGCTINFCSQNGVFISSNNNLIDFNRITNTLKGIEIQSETAAFSNTISNNTIGLIGFAPNSGFTSVAISFFSGSNNIAFNNYIGVDKNGASLPVIGNGIFVQLSPGTIIRKNIIGNISLLSDFGGYGSALEAYGTSRLGNGIIIYDACNGSVMDSNYVGIMPTGLSIPIEKAGMLLTTWWPGAGGTMFYYEGNNNFQVTYNKVANCGFAGIQTVGVAQSVISHNTVGLPIQNGTVSNGSYGIYILSSAELTIASNTIAGHTKDGLIIKGIQANEYPFYQMHPAFNKHNLLSRNIIYSNGNAYKAINLNYATEGAGNNNEAIPLINPNPVNNGNNIVLTGTSGNNRKIQIFAASASPQSALEYLGETTADGSGIWTYTVENLTSSVNYFTATATDITPLGSGFENNTSELSAAIYVCTGGSVPQPNFVAYTFCEGKPLIAGQPTHLNITSPVSGVSYDWDTDGDNVTDFSTASAQTTYTFPSVGTYNVKVVARNSCSSNTSSAPYDVIKFTLMNPSGRICRGSSATLTVGTSVAYPAENYVWYRNETRLTDKQGPSLEITEGGKYVVVIKNLSCVLNESEYNTAPVVEGNGNGEGSVQADITQDPSEPGQMENLPPPPPSTNLAYAATIVYVRICPGPGGGGCGNCISSFMPVADKEYLLSVWVKEVNTDGTLIENYNHAGVNLEFIFKDNTSYIHENLLVAAGTPMIEGWQKLEQKFIAPPHVDGIYGVKIKLLGSLTTDVYYDDLRIIPMSGSIKSYVYDPLTMRLMSELDENNFATYYEYDQSGALIRIKKETERGIMTIQESMNNTFKR